MSWRIHAWDPATGVGAVVSSHFGPLPFGTGENVDGTPDFLAGEDVVVELARGDGGYRITAVRPARQRQPEGTHHPRLDELNAHRQSDLRVEARTDDHLGLWLGDCCVWCGPGWLIDFRGVTATVGLVDDLDLDDPWFRLASAAERAELALAVPAGSEAYCIVTGHGAGRDGPRVFIVACAVDVATGPPPAPDP